ncbi:MAG TPA: hypothetical protein VJJ24_01765 [Candidatus Paceibacterota bacterium]
MSTSTRVWIPPITDEHLRELAGRIKPVIQFKHRGFRRKGRRYVKPVDLRGVAYTWDPKPARPARDLEPIVDITTYHSYGAPVFFKPSIAEVLAQIPAEYLDAVVAFEIVESPEHRDDLYRDGGEALNAGYHVATTRLYRRKTAA